MESLAQHVEQHGPMAVRDAIGWIARAAMTVAVLHAEGRVHGRLSPRAISIAEASCASDGLLEAPERLPDDPEYHGPHRAREGKPTEYDDIWALTAILYWVLTGALPYPGGVEAHRRGGKRRPPAAIAVQRSDLDVLQRLVDRVMAPRHPLPARTVDQLLDELRDLSPAVDDLPPLPLRAAPKRSSIAAAGWRPHGVALVVLTLLIAGAVWWGSRRETPSADGPPEPTVGAARDALPPPSSTLPPPSSAPSRAASAPSAPAPVPRALSTEDLVACTAGLIAADAFEHERVAMDFPCRERDPARGVAVVSRAILRGGAGHETKAWIEWRQLGWYRLAAFAVARAQCCKNPPPLILPAPISRCRLDEALDGLTAAARDRDSALLAAVEETSRAFDCAHEMDAGGRFGLQGAPGSGQMALFLRALTRLRETSR